MWDNIIDIEQRLHTWIRDFGKEKNVQFISDLKIVLYENNRLRKESPNPMIEGLKVTVSGEELSELCNERATYHYERSGAYETQIESMLASRIEGMNYTNGDPVQALRDRMATHNNEGNELEFIAAHLERAEKYLLSSADLQKLGITKSRY